MNKYDGINRPEVYLSNGTGLYGQDDNLDGYAGENCDELQGGENAGCGNSGVCGYCRAPSKEGGTRDGRRIERVFNCGGDNASGERTGKKTNFNDASEQKSGRLKGFLLRALCCTLLLAFAFLPRIFPYKGSENVTQTIKTIVMTDITGNDAVGEGKLVEIIRDFFENKKGKV